MWDSNFIDLIITFLSDKDLVNNGGHWKTEDGGDDDVKALDGLELDYVSVIGGDYCRDGF